MDEQLFSTQHAQSNTQLTSLATRLKLAEERYRNLRKRHQLTEDALLRVEKEMKTHIRVMTTQITNMRKKILDIDTKVDAIQGELKSVVQRHEFQMLDRYVDLWQPTNFVTRDEAKRLIGEKHG